MVGSITDWHALFKEAYRCLKPGGWFESYEGSPSLNCDNDTIPPTSAMGQWGPLFINGGRQVGRSFTVVEDEIQRAAMEAAGFVDIQEKTTKVCIVSSHLQKKPITDFFFRSPAVAGRRISV